jgi:hypothetical protein
MKLWAEGRRAAALRQSFQHYDASGLHDASGLQNGAAAISRAVWPLRRSTTPAQIPAGTSNSGISRSPGVKSHGGRSGSIGGRHLRRCSRARQPRG